MRSQIFRLLLLLTLLGCSEKSSEQTEPTRFYETQPFSEYWYAGKAEVNSYMLIQNRYGEERVGNAVLIFVTEDFSQSKQVKLDDPEIAGHDKVSVLKMNFTKNFVTGIYPYSMMLSAFTPIRKDQQRNTLKLAMSSQEWCGQVYAQANLRNKSYTITGHSYFEEEGDQNLYLKAVWLEDELWNRIRLDPGALPVGEIEIIPGLFFSRLNHIGLDVEKAICAKEESTNQVTYSISYPEHQRTLTIEFEKKFPHRIKGWTEQWELGGKMIISKATLDKQLVTDYWTKNKNEFLHLRDTLGLSHKNY